MKFSEAKEKFLEGLCWALTVGMFLFVVCFMHTIAHRSSEFFMDKFLGLFKPTSMFEESEE